MEKFSVLLALCAGNSPVTGEFPAQRPVARSFDVFFDLRLNVWVNNREAGELRRNRAHYDVIVMGKIVSSQISDTMFIYLNKLAILLPISCLVPSAHLISRGHVYQDP